MAQGPLLPKRRSPIDAGGAAAGLPAKQPHLRMTVCATTPPRSSGHLIWPLRDCPQICEGLETEDTQPCREASASRETASWKLQQRGPKQAVSSWLSEKCVFSLTRPIFSPARAQALRRETDAARLPVGVPPELGLWSQPQRALGGKGAPRLRLPSWGLQLYAGAPSAGMDRGAPSPEPMEGARGQLVDPVCRSATKRRLWLNLPIFLVVMDCLLVAESHESGPEGGNRLYPLKGIALNAQDHSHESSMSYITSRVRF